MLFCCPCSCPTLTAFVCRISDSFDREKTGIARVKSSPVIYGSYHAEGSATKVPTSVFIFSLPARQLNMRVASLVKAKSCCRKQTNPKPEAAQFACMDSDFACCRCKLNAIDFLQRVSSNFDPSKKNSEQTGRWVIHLHAKNKDGQFLIYSSCGWLLNRQLHRRKANIPCPRGPRAIKSSCCMRAAARSYCRDQIHQKPRAAGLE